MPRLPNTSTSPVVLPGSDESLVHVHHPPDLLSTVPYRSSQIDWSKDSSQITPRSRSPKPSERKIDWLGISLPVAGPSAVPKKDSAEDCLGIEECQE